MHSTPTHTQPPSPAPRRARSAARPLLVLVAFAAALAAPACDGEPSCADDGTCVDPNAPHDGGPTPTTDGGDGVTPPGCDATADAKDAPACVVNEFAVFVDGAGGADTNPGTKEAPVRSITHALTKVGERPRIYVCGEGTYEESVALTKPISIFGGFDCGSWTYSAKRAKVAPTEPGYALHAAGLTSAVTIADLDFAAKDAVGPGASSVALFLSDSAGVTLRRVDARAGEGQDAEDAPEPATNLLEADKLKGKSPDGAAGAEENLCACIHYGTSTGGKGGNAGNPKAASGGDGAATPPATVSGRTGAGGGGFKAANGGPEQPCISGSTGPDGAARAAGTGADRHGTLAASGWTPAPGTDGEAGNPGGGGGGGGGGETRGGGGGGCGGCGGSGGTAGQGGGASIALLAFQTALRLDTVTLHAAKAGAGGKASAGEGGQGGGEEGTGGTCGGGRGGNGAGGGGAGGGAGGISAGVVRAGGTLDGSPQVTLGAAGAGGAGSDGGPGGTYNTTVAPKGNDGTNGKDGVSEAVLVLD